MGERILLKQERTFAFGYSGKLAGQSQVTFATLFLVRFVLLLTAGLMMRLGGPVCAIVVTPNAVWSRPGPRASLSISVMDRFYMCAVHCSSLQPHVHTKCLRTTFIVFFF